MKENAQLGNVVDYLFAFVDPSIPGALAYRSWDVAIGYLLMAATFFLIAIWTRGRELPVIEH
jgi:hypothetical protein